MMGFNMLWPTFAMVALVFAVWGTLVVRRVRHIRANPPSRAAFATGDAARRYFEPVEHPASNLANLFEMPVLFFALVPLLILTRQGGDVQVALAWLFVALRAVHSWEHVGRNRITPRFMIYAASVAVLAAMWLGFFADAVSAAATYREAMTGLVAQP